MWQLALLQYSHNGEVEHFKGEFYWAFKMIPVAYCPDFHMNEDLWRKKKEVYYTSVLRLWKNKINSSGQKVWLNQRLCATTHAHTLLISQLNL